MTKFTPEPEDRFIGDAEEGQISGLSRSTRWRLRKAGKFPPLYQTSPGRKSSLLSMVRHWQAERIAAASNTEQGVADQERNQQEANRAQDPAA